MGESWNINHNLEWERLRFLAATIYSARAEKPSQRVKPTDLFPLPQDVFLKAKKPQSNYNQYKAFAEKVKKFDKDLVVFDKKKE